MAAHQVPPPWDSPGRNTFRAPYIFNVLSTMEYQSQVPFAPVQHSSAGLTVTPLWHHSPAPPSAHSCFPGPSQVRSQGHFPNKLPAHKVLLQSPFSGESILWQSQLPIFGIILSTSKNASFILLYKVITHSIIDCNMFPTANIVKSINREP